MLVFINSIIVLVSVTITVSVSDTVTSSFDFRLVMVSGVVAAIL